MLLHDVGGISAASPDSAAVKYSYIFGLATACVFGLVKNKLLLAHCFANKSTNILP
jgi:hypothetical protein